MRLRSRLKSLRSECGRPRPQQCPTSNRSRFLQRFTPIHVAAPEDGRTPSESVCPPRCIFRQALNHLLLALMLLAGCASAPRAQIQRKPDSFPTDALITQRGVLTVLGRQFTLNGYLATSATNGQRLVVTENFGNVLADVLVKPDGKAYVMKSSRAFKPKWIERHIAADVRCLFGDVSDSGCPVQTIGTNRFLIERRWYKLDLQTVQIKPGVQSAELFDATKVKSK